MAPLLDFLVRFSFVQIVEPAVLYKRTGHQSTGAISSALLLCVLVCIVLNPHGAVSGQEGFKQYVDARGRFHFSYPATMRVEASTPDEVRISHPKATLRITVLVEKRPRKTAPDVKALLDAFRNKLKEDTKDSSILEEGRLPGLEGSQGYIICSFKDGRGVKVVQLVQYYLTEDQLLQMIIADRPEGFINVEKVVRQIHRSFKVLNPKFN